MASIFDSFFNQGKDDRQPAEVKYKNEKNTDKNKIKIKATVYGQVQGVGFRFTTKHLADEVGISGIVRNENDGSVYIEAIGTDDQIEQFITEIAKGPSPSANVDRVTVEYDNSLPNYGGFSERY